MLLANLRKMFYKSTFVCAYIHPVISLCHFFGCPILIMSSNICWPWCPASLSIQTKSSLLSWYQHQVKPYKFGIFHTFLTSPFPEFFHIMALGRAWSHPLWWEKSGLIFIPLHQQQWKIRHWYRTYHIFWLRLYCSWWFLGGLLDGLDFY